MINLENRIIIGPPPKRFGYITLVLFGIISVLAVSFIFFYEFSNVCVVKRIQENDPIQADKVKMVLLEKCGIIKNDRVELKAMGSDKMIPGVVLETSGEIITLIVSNELSTFTNSDQKFEIYFNRGSLFNKITNRNKVISFKHK